MLMNDGATIANNDIKKCTYFLSLLEGPQVDGWSEMKYTWLDDIKRDPSLLMGCSPWTVMMCDFLDAFTDFAESEKAQNAMRTWKMHDSKVDEYIAGFEQLAMRAGSISMTHRICAPSHKDCQAHSSKLSSAKITPRLTSNGGRLPNVIIAVG